VSSKILDYVPLVTVSLYQAILTTCIKIIL